jgi:hypothetical protein
MGCVKELIGELGARGYVAVDAADLRRWRKVTGEPLRTVSVRVEVRGSAAVERCLPAETVRRLADDPRLESGDRGQLRWLMRVAGIRPNPRPGCCPECGDDNVSFRVEAQLIGNRLVVNNADEPEGPTFEPLARCEECGATVEVEFPAWTPQHRHDALAAYNGPALRDALAALHRLAVEAGVTGVAVGLAAERLRGCEVEPVDPLAGYKQRTAERMKRLDAMEGKCAWGELVPTVEQERCRAKWTALMDEQGADEVANGL